MSLNTFKVRPNVTVSYLFDCSGTFDPFGPTGGTVVPIAWTLSGTITGSNRELNVPVKSITCTDQALFTQSSDFSFFDLDGSTGNTSGYVPVGLLPETREGQPLGAWTVNTSPVLQPNGKVDGGDPPALGYYVVALPTGATVNDPIVISPAIDTLTRVYPGDAVAVQNGLWRVYPQRRLGAPDRTFLWTPNTSPVVASGGLVNGVLAKPGTILIPDKDFYIAPPAPAIEGRRYFYKGQGLLFNGQLWRKKLEDPWKSTVDPTQFWLASPNYESLNLYENLLEQTHRKKCDVYANIKQDPGSELTYSVSYDGGTPFDVPAYMANFFALNIGPVGGCLQAQKIFYNHSDAYSFHEQQTRAWAKINYKLAYAASTDVYITGQIGQPDPSFPVYIDFFEDGNITQWETEAFDPDGAVIKNNFKLTTSISVTV